MSKSTQNYNEIEAMRVSEIREFAISNISDVIADIKNPKQPSDFVRIGTAFHSLILRNDRGSEKLPDNIQILDFADWRTKEARECKQKYYDSKDDYCPLLKQEYENIISIINSNIENINNIFNGEGEYEIAFVDEFDDEPLNKFKKIKGRIDYLTKDCVVDLKTCSSLSGLDKKIFDMGYQLQMYLYMRLSGVENAKLVFLHTASGLLEIKNLDIIEIAPECEALLKKANKTFDEFQLYNTMGSVATKISDYMPPQWALGELLRIEAE